MARTLISGGTIGVLVIVVTSVYALLNDSGHTGVEPLVLYFYFVPLLILSVARYCQGGRGGAIFCVGVAIVGIVLITALDAMTVLVEYDRWASRGMPDRGTFSWW